MTTPLTDRDRAKDERRRALVDAAAALFARRGFAAVTMAELGAAAGVSGPALYRHFAGKQALLDELLTGVSRELYDGGEAVVSGSRGEDALAALVDFHAAFALGRPDVITVQDRDLAAASDAARAEVRRLQRAYVGQWVATLAGVRPGIPPAELTFRVHAVFGLLNSTPHALRASGLGAASAGRTLRALAHATLLAE